MLLLTFSESDIKEKVKAELEETREDLAKEEWLNLTAYFNPDECSTARKGGVFF